MASLSDILTAAKNIVTALSQLGQTYLQSVGSQQMANITTTTLVLEGQGRVARLSVIVPGSAVGAIYDSASTASLTNQIAIIPTSTGITEIDLPVNSGIVVAPGTGQTVVISYS